MTPDDLRGQIELKIVELIKARLADGTMTEEESQAISSRVLELLKPGMSFEELFKAIPQLDDGFPALSPIVAPLMRDYEERIVKEAQKNVIELIHEGQYDAAAKLADQAVKQDIPLTWIGKGKPIDNE